MTRERVEVVVSARTIARIVVVTLALLALAYELYAVRRVLLLVFVALFLAVALEPAVYALERAWKRRGLAVAAVSVATFGTLIVLGGLIATPLYNEVVRFVGDLPSLVEDLSKSRVVADLDRRFGLIEKATELANDLPSRLPNTVSALLGIAGRVASSLVSILTVIVMTIFFLIELPRLRASAKSLMVPSTADRFDALGSEVSRAVSRYVAGSLIVATIAGTTTFIALTILGVPFALALALLMALFDLIPLVGATIGSIVVVLVAFTQGAVPGIAMLVIALVYQQLENNLIQPLVMRRSVSVSPLVILPAVLAGSTLLGVVGALLAIPVAGSLQIATRELIEARREAMAEQRAQRAFVFEE